MDAVLLVNELHNNLVEVLCVLQEMNVSAIELCDLTVRNVLLQPLSIFLGIEGLPGTIGIQAGNSNDVFLITMIVTIPGL